MDQNERDEQAWRAVIEGMEVDHDDENNIGVSFDLKSGEPFLRATFVINGEHYPIPLPVSTILEWAGVFTHAAEMIVMQFGTAEHADQIMRDMLKEN